MKEVTFEDIRELALGNLSPFTVSEIAELLLIADKEQFFLRFKEMLNGKAIKNPTASQPINWISV